MHDPARAKQRHRAQQAGGYARHGRRIGKVGAPEQVAIQDVGDLLTLLTSTVNDLLALENSIARGRALLLAVSTGVKVLEVGALEERLSALEEQLL